MKKAISYLLIFLGLQLLGGAVINLGWSLVTKQTEPGTAQLITTSAVISAVTIAVFLLARWAEVSPRWIRTRPWMVLFWSVIAALGALIPSAWIQEQMPELPNLVEQEFDMILRNRWGYLAIGLLAPLAEEMVFRGAILKSLLNSPRLSPWAAIGVSALLFSLIHMNPAQMPHAFVIGLLLGWMYWRTGSILPGMAYHWANNSVAYAMYNIYPNPDMKLVELFKGSESNVLMAVGFSLLILLPALYQLHVWMRRADER
ncbi:MAG: CPBP family intramembrane metalloprotease [Prevotella sp.]|nr:CPBP family intramembrane metalloprotease [Prevotella sp.]